LSINTTSIDLSREHCLLLVPDLMEAVDNAHAEGAILWLAQTILANLLLDKLDSWFRHVGLAGLTERLMSEVERVEMVVAAVKGRANGNRPLTRSLARLKELMYDADDVDTWWMSSTIAGSSNRSKEVGVHLVYSFFI